MAWINGHSGTRLLKKKRLHPLLEPEFKNEYHNYINNNKKNGLATQHVGYNQWTVFSDVFPQFGANVYWPTFIIYLALNNHAIP